MHDNDNVIHMFTMQGSSPGVLLSKLVSTNFTILPVEKVKLHEALCKNTRNQISYGKLCNEKH